MSPPQDEGWTVVRYGRRGRPRNSPIRDFRPQPTRWGSNGYRSGRRVTRDGPGWDRRLPDFRAVREGRYSRWGPDGHRSWDGDTRGDFWMDRAFPDAHSGGGRGRYPFPNQPVPPRRFSPRFGPRPQNPSRNKYGPANRTYAEVVRRNNPDLASRTRTDASGRGRKDKTVRQPPRTVSNDRTHPTDPNFGRLVRKLYSAIKIVHHLQNVNQKPGTPDPVMICRMVQHLASMIKPAFPNSTTSDLILGNAKEWGYNTLATLETHYKQELEKVLGDLSKSLPTEWKEAFEVATKWAHKNLPRIKMDVIDHVAALITACAHPDTEQRAQPQEETPSVAPPGQQPPITSTQHPLHTQLPVTSTQAPTIQKQTDHATSRPPLNQAGKAVEPSPQGEGQNQWELDFLDLTLHEVSDVSVKPRSRTGPQYTTTVGTMTEQVAQSSWEEDSPLVDLLAGDVVPDTPVPDSPKEQRQPREVGRNPCVLLDESLFGGISEGEESSVDSNPFRVAPRQQPPISQPLVQVHQPPELNQEHWYEDLLSSLDLTFGDTSTPKPSTVWVHRNPNTQRKMVDWELTVTKKWLIIGDSNLSRFPSYSLQNLQIESYPGANFRHAEEVICKASVQTTVEKVVLAFGINSRGQKAKETAVKQVQGALRATKRKFPYSEIWIPLLNFSPLLLEAERQTLDELNSHIERNMPFLPALDDTFFQTEDDNVHWTGATARAMLDHWVTFLNLRTPQTK